MRHILITCVVLAAPLGAQANMPPVNALPNPYTTIEGWAKLPEGRTWGSTSAVAIDRDGSSVWVAERCGANSCTTSTLDPILHFDANGKLLASFGKGMFQAPHGIYVDADGNIWVTDCACTGGRGAARGAGGGAEGRGGGGAESAPGHLVYKFSPAGKLLMTLGTPGGGRDSAYFFTPNAILVAPNGEIYVSEGHSSQQGSSTARILKFDKTGKLLTTWGSVMDSTRKSDPYSFNQPHALAMDSRGRLFVGDRGYDRIKIFDQSGKLLDTWYQFSRPSGIFIDRNDNIYVADSESGSVNPAHGAWKRGIRIGSARDGKVTAFIPDPVDSPPSTSAAEGVAVDAKGNIYGAEVGPKALKRYVRNGS